MAVGIIHIESLDDPRVADYRAITNPSAMHRAGLFVAEGRLVVERLLETARFRVRSLLLTPAALRQLAGEGGPFHRIGGAQGLPLLVAVQPVMDAIVGFNLHRGCVAIAERPVTPALCALPLATMGRVLVLEGVGNPDNIGGIFRSAAAFGVDAVIIGPGCGDPYYRKAIRTSMGATLRVPFADAGPWPEALTTIRNAGLTLFALTPAADAAVLTNLSPASGRRALLVGGEGPGLTAAALAAADQRVRIATTDNVDSLNVTVAASIALHHFAR